MSEVSGGIQKVKQVLHVKQFRIMHQSGPAVCVQQNLLPERIETGTSGVPP